MEKKATTVHAKQPPKSPFMGRVEAFAEVWLKQLPSHHHETFMKGILAIGNEHDRIVHTLEQVMHRKDLAYARDDLTSLVRRKPYFNALTDLLRTPQTASIKAIGIIWIDLDRFKQINDNKDLGHSVGDLVLKYASKTIRETIRSARDDFFDRIERRESILDDNYAAGRWGGDEFLVTVEMSAPEDLGIVCKRLKVNINDPVRQEKAGLTMLPTPVSVSVGGVSYRLPVSPEMLPFPAENLGDKLIDLADKEMYKAKADECIHFVITKIQGDDLVIEEERTM